MSYSCKPVIMFPAKAYGGGEDQQVAEDAEKLGQIQEQWEGKYVQNMAL